MVYFFPCNAQSTVHLCVNLAFAYFLSPFPIIIIPSSSSLFSLLCIPKYARSLEMEEWQMCMYYVKELSFYTLNVFYIIIIIVHTQHIVICFSDNERCWWRNANNRKWKTLDSQKRRVMIFVFCFLFHASYSSFALSLSLSAMCVCAHVSVCCSNHFNSNRYTYTFIRWLLMYTWDLLHLLRARLRKQNNMFAAKHQCDMWVSVCACIFGKDIV